MTKISVGPFELDVELQGDDLKVKMKVGYHKISASETFTLSLNHPEVTWNSRTILDFSVSISIGYDDNTGTLSAKATETYPTVSFSGVHKHHKHQSVSVKILPDHTLAYVSAGLPVAGVVWMIKHLPISEFPTPSDVLRFRKLLTSDRLSALKTVYNYQSGADHGRHLFDGIMSLMKGLAGDAAKKADFGIVGGIARDKWVEIFQRSVADPVVQAKFPGIQHKLSFPGDAVPVVTSMAQDDDSAAKRVQKIALDVLEGSGIALTAIGIVAAIVFGGLGVVAAASGGTATPVVGGIAVIATIVLLVLALEVIAVGAVAGMVYLAVDGYLAIAGDAAVSIEATGYPFLDGATDLAA